MDSGITSWTRESHPKTWWNTVAQLECHGQGTGSPRGNLELASSHREVSNLQPDVRLSPSGSVALAWDWVG